jgi:hypothetical protein
MDALPSSGPAAQKAEPWGPGTPANQTNPWGGPAAPTSTSDSWPSFGKNPVIGVLCLPLECVKGIGQDSALNWPSIEVGGAGVKPHPVLSSDAQQGVMSLLLGD